MSVSSPKQIDPYRMWLNVTETRRPLHHYALLNLTLFEADAAKIEAAALRQRSALQAHRHAGHDDAWLRVNNQLEEAVSTLGKAELKARYDERLQRQLQNSKTNGSATAIGSGDTLLISTAGQSAPPGQACGQCGHRNAPHQKFCSGCGKSLTDVCARCSQANSATAAFCGNCGANLKDVASEQVCGAETRLAEAQRFREEARYFDALSQLNALARLNQPHVLGVAAKARELIPLVQKEFDQRSARAVIMVEMVEEQLAAHDYKRAVSLVEEIPPPLRGEELLELYSTAQAHYANTRRWKEEIRSGLAEKRYGDVLSAIDQLLKLQPHKVELRELAGKLQVHYVQSFEKRLAKNLYDDAMQVLARVPESLRTPQVMKLYNAAAERALLQRDIRQAPVVTPALARLAARLVKLSPSDKQADLLAHELAEKMKLADVQRHAAPPNWATPPQRTQLNLPVDMAFEFRRLVPQAIANSPLLAKAPQQFAVACGLALQGLGVAALDTSLGTTESGGFLRRLGEMSKADLFSRGKSQVKTAWGLDLSSAGLKAVKLQAEGDPLKITVVAADVIDHAKILSLPDAELDRTAIIKETLSTFKGRNDLKGDKTVAGLSGAKVLARFFSLPPVPPKNIDDAVKFEAAHQVAMPLAELVWDYSVLDAVDPKSKELNSHKVLVVAAKNLHVRERLELFREAGIKIDFLQADPAALHNFLAYEHFHPTANSAAKSAGTGLIALDVGSDVTNLVFCAPPVTWWRSVPLGGNDFTKAVVKALNCTFAQAELIKRNPAQAPSVYLMYESLREHFEGLLGEMQRSLAAFNAAHGDIRLEQVLGYGGSFHMHGLFRFLRTGW